MPSSLGNTLLNLNQCWKLEPLKNIESIWGSQQAVGQNGVLLKLLWMNGSGRQFAMDPWDMKPVVQLLYRARVPKA